MLLKVKSKLFEISKDIILEPKIYLNQSLYFEYLINNEILAISYNQKNKKIYFYFRSKKDISDFKVELENIGYSLSNNVLTLNVGINNVDYIANILVQTLHIAVKIIDDLDMTFIDFDTRKSVEVIAGISNVDLSRCVDQSIVGKLIG